MFSGPDRQTDHGSDRGRDVAAAVRDRALSARFQPIVDLRRGQIAAFECLTRPAPESGFDNPAEFFDEAERSGQLWEVEEATRGIAFDEATGWPPGAFLFMNCSPQVIADPRFISSIKEGLARAGGLAASRVVLEITERSDEQADTAIIEQVDRLRGEGFQIAIDDVGAGTSGLTRIMSIRPSWLKLDRELIEGIDADRGKQNLVRFLLNFSRLSGVRLVAEGIERREELETLIDIGVPFGQGYLLGRPGGLDQTLEPALREQIRGAWSGAAGLRYRDPRSVSIAAFARPATEVDAATPIAEVAEQCLRDRGGSGVIVLSGDEPIGWAPRELILRAASDPRAGSGIGTLTGLAQTAVNSETTVVEALEIASARDARHAGDPLVLRDRGRTSGVVGIPDLLAAAAEICRFSPLGVVSPAGLPGRVLCERHAARLLDESNERRIGPGPDAAFIDIRGLLDYNTAFGHELGDELLQSLAGALTETVQSAGRDAFLGHLGDDRFFLVASPGRIRGLATRLAERFERTFHHSPPALEEGAGEGRGVGLRILIAVDPFRRAQTLRDLFEIERSLRDQASPADDLPPSTLIAVDEPAPALRRVA